MLKNFVSLHTAGKLVKRRFSLYNQNLVHSSPIISTVTQISLKRDENCKLSHLEDIRVTILRCESLTFRHRASVY